METKTTIEIARDRWGNCRLTMARQKRTPGEHAYGPRHALVDENCLSEADALRRVLEVFDLTAVPAQMSTVAGWRVLEVG